MQFPQVDRLRLVVLISGGGTTLRNFLAQIDSGRLAADIQLVISSSPSAAGLRFAEERAIRTQVIERKSHFSPEDFSRAVFGACRSVGPHFVVMGGFLKHVLIPEDFESRVLNIHPGLIPAFCGRGMYGRHVHEAVLAHGVKVSGCTVHFVDNQYDHGPIILQRTVRVEDDDTPDTLAARVFEAECEAYPEALRLLASGTCRLEGRRVIVR